MDPEETTVRDELTALRKIAAILDSLDRRSQLRAVDYIADRYSPPIERVTANADAR